MTREIENVWCDNHIKVNQFRMEEYDVKDEKCFGEHIYIKDKFDHSTIKFVSNCGVRAFRSSKMIL